MKSKNAVSKITPRAVKGCIVTPISLPVSKFILSVVDSAPVFGSGPTFRICDAGSLVAIKGKKSILIWDLVQNELKTKFESALRIGKVGISGDGRFAVFINAREIQKFNTQSGEVKILCDIKNDSEKLFATSKNHVAIPHKTSGDRFLVKVQNYGEDEVRYQFEVPILEWFEGSALSSNGKYFAVANGKKKKIQVYCEGKLIISNIPMSQHNQINGFVGENLLVHSSNGWSRPLTYTLWDCTNKKIVWSCDIPQGHEYIGNTSVGIWFVDFNVNTSKSTVILRDHLSGIVKDRISTNGFRLSCIAKHFLFADHSSGEIKIISHPSMLKSFPGNSFHVAPLDSFRECLPIGEKILYSFDKVYDGLKEHYLNCFDLLGGSLEWQKKYSSAFSMDINKSHIAISCKDSIDLYSLSGELEKSLDLKNSPKFSRGIALANDGCIAVLQDMRIYLWSQGSSSPCFSIAIPKKFHAADQFNPTLHFSIDSQRLIAHYFLGGGVVLGKVNNSWKNCTLVTNKQDTFWKNGDFYVPREESGVSSDNKTLRLRRTTNEGSEVALSIGIPTAIGKCKISSTCDKFVVEVDLGESKRVAQVFLLNSGEKLSEIPLPYGSSTGWNEIKLFDDKLIVSEYGKHLIFDCYSGDHLATLYGITEGFLWTAPATEVEKSRGVNEWLYTNREDLVNVIVDETTNGSIAVIKDAEERKLFLAAVNKKERVLSALYDAEKANKDRLMSETLSRLSPPKDNSSFSELPHPLNK
ncbi:MAG: hypothetical protein GKR91_19165 [Pseudomonadales bacterium]|nr:hypothetical protein [Pseudomonadales bacterium]